MKILGKYKDYYDYLQGIYGVDPLLVLDRRYDHIEIRRPDEETKNKLISKSFFVADKKYNIYYYNKTAYYTLEEIVHLNEILEENKQTEDMITMPWKYNLGRNYWSYKDKEILTQEWWNEQNGKTFAINKKRRIPVLMCTNLGPRRKTEISYSPCILKQWDFHKVMTAEEVYREVSTMLGYFVDHPVIPNKQTNMEKLLSHGFDKTKSFRHRK